MAVNQINIFLIFLSIIILISSSVVVFIKTPLHSIISLIVCFVATSIFLFLLECEFLALLFLIVYVGAIAVLFLFVIMMLDLKSSLVNDTSNYHYLVVGTVISLSFYLLIVGTLDFLYESNNYESLTWFRNFHENLCLEDEISEIASLGQVMYTQYVLQFLIAGLILTLAVIGVAVLTVNVSSNSGSQINSNKCL